MKILFIPGIKTMFYHYLGWQADISELTNVGIIFAKHVYVHLQWQRCEDFVEYVNNLIREEKPDVLLCHSFGGIIAKTALSRLSSHSVTTLVTMASPHTMQYGGLQVIKHRLHTPDTIDLPTVLTYGAKYDAIVPDKFTRLPNGVHTTIQGIHMSFLFDSVVRKQVLDSFL